MMTGRGIGPVPFLGVMICVGLAGGPCAAAGVIGGPAGGELFLLTLDVVGPGQGTVAVKPDRTEYPYGEEVSLYAQALSGSYFDGWGGDAAQMGNPAYLIMNSNKSVTAYFGLDETYKFTLKIEITGLGGVKKTPDRLLYPRGEQVKLTAVPTAGWRFDHWEGDTPCGGTIAPGTKSVSKGDVLCRDNPGSLVMNANKVVKAIFVELQATRYELRTEVVGNGFLTEDPPDGVYAPGTEVQIHAYAQTDDWVFDHWEGDADGKANPVRILMDADKSVTAVFVAKSGGEGEGEEPVAAWGMLRGTLTDRGSGEPISCATVVAHQSYRESVATVDDVGEYYFDTIPAGDHRLTVYAPGYMTQEANVTIGRDALFVQDFALQSRGSVGAVRGSALDDRVNQPLSGVRVDALVDGEVAATAYTCATGAYELGQVPVKDKVVQIRFMAAGYDSKTQETTIEPGQTVEVNAELHSKCALPGTILGVVRDTTGEQVAAAQLTAVKSGGPGHPGESDARGEYVIAGLDDGTYTVSATRSPAYERQVREVAVPQGGGQPMQADFALERTGAAGEGEGEDVSKGCFSGILEDNEGRPSGRSGGDALVFVAVALILAFGHLKGSKKRMDIAGQNL